MVSSRWSESYISGEFFDEHIDVQAFDDHVDDDQLPHDEGHPFPVFQDDRVAEEGDGAPDVEGGQNALLDGEASTSELVLDVKGPSPGVVGRSICIAEGKDWCIPLAIRPPA